MPFDYQLSTAAAAACSILSLSGWQVCHYRRHDTVLRWKDFQLVVNNATGLISVPEVFHSRFKVPEVRGSQDDARVD